MPNQPGMARLSVVKQKHSQGLALPCLDKVLNVCTGKSGRKKSQLQLFQAVEAFIQIS